MGEIVWGAVWAELVDPFFLLLLCGLCWAMADRSEELAKKNPRFYLLTAFFLIAIVTSSVFFGIEASEFIKALLAPEYYGYMLLNGR